MNTTYLCKALVVDDSDVAATIGDALPHEVKLTCVKTVEEALSQFSPPVLPMTTDYSQAGAVKHDFDVVLLDWNLGKKQMQAYPLGGLSLQSLFQTCFVKPWPCFVIGYSDYLHKKPRLHWLLNFLEARARGSAQQRHLFASGVSKIPWLDILEERAETILKKAPPNVVQEIVAATEEANGDITTLVSRQLPELAAYMQIGSVTIADIFHKKQFKSTQLWKFLDPILSSGSRCRNIYDLYLEKAIHDFAHVSTRQVILRTLGVTLDCSSSTVSVQAEVSSASSSTKTVREYCVPRSIVKDLARIEKAHERDASTKAFCQRCEQVHKVFRLSLARTDRTGYIYTGWPDKHNEDVYIYLPKDVLASLLDELHSQIRTKARRIGPLVSEDGRWAVFYFQQGSRSIAPRDVATLPNVISTRRKWGPFPELLHWGVLCVTDQNGSCKCVWPNGMTDVSAKNLKAPRNSLGLRFPVYGA